MTVSAGDVVGFYMQSGKEGVRLAWFPVPDDTLLRGSRSAAGVAPVATFSDDSTTILSSSPLVSVEFGKYAIIPYLHAELLTTYRSAHQYISCVYLLSTY